MTDVAAIRELLASGVVFDLGRPGDMTAIDPDTPPIVLPLSGSNAAVGSSVEGVWEASGRFAYPDGADADGEQLEVVCTGQDHSSGTGLRWLRLLAETASGDRIYEDIEASITAAVATTATDIARVIDARGIDFGSGGAAAADIEIQRASDNAVVEQISAGRTAAESARAWVPRGYVGVVPWMAASIIGTDPAYVSLAHDWDHWTGRRLNSPSARRWIHITASGTISRDPLVPIILPPETRVEINAIRADSTDAKVAVDGEVLLFRGAG